MKFANHKSIDLSMNESATDEYFFPYRIDLLEVIKPDPWEIFSEKYRLALIDVKIFNQLTYYNQHFLPSVLQGENVNRMSRLGMNMTKSKKMYAPILDLSTKQFFEGRHRYWFILKMNVTKMIVAIKDKQYELKDRFPFIIQCTDVHNYDVRMFSDNPDSERLIQEHQDYFKS